MTPDDFLLRYIRPATRLLAEATGVPETPEAEVMLLAIAGQESNLSARWQRGGGPARGMYQFERGGGLKGVMEHARTRGKLMGFCAEIAIPFEEAKLWEGLPYSEMLQTALARLLLWSDPRPLPSLGASGDAWATYLRNWRPGKPHVATWPTHYGRAIDAVQANSPAPRPGLDPRVVSQVRDLTGKLSEWVAKL